MIGRADRDGLIKPKAFVILQAGDHDTEALVVALQTHVKDRIGVWKYPRWIEFVDSLPKTATGKIQRFRSARGLMRAGHTSAQRRQIWKPAGGAPVRMRRRHVGAVARRVGQRRRCGATSPSAWHLATGWGVFAYSRFGYGGSDTTTVAAADDLHAPRRLRWCCLKCLRAANIRAGGAGGSLRWRIDRGDLCGDVWS